MNDQRTCAHDVPFTEDRCLKCEGNDSVKLPPNFKINGMDHPHSVIARAATIAERERCAQIVEQMAGFNTHKFRKQVAKAIRNPHTFYEKR